MITPLPDGDHRSGLKGGKRSDPHTVAHVAEKVDFEQFIRVVRQIDDFFVTVVKLPGT